MGHQAEAMLLRLRAPKGRQHNVLRRQKKLLCSHTPLGDEACAADLRAVSLASQAGLLALLSQRPALVDLSHMAGLQQLSTAQ